VILLLRMLQRSASGYQLEEVHASLHLLQQMLASNKVRQSYDRVLVSYIKYLLKFRIKKRYLVCQKQNAVFLVPAAGFATLYVHGLCFIFVMLQVLAQLLLDLDGAVATVTARHDGRLEDCLRCNS
jgi:hypothetical protein